MLCYELQLVHLSMLYINVCSILSYSYIFIDDPVLLSFVYSHDPLLCTAQSDVNNIVLYYAHLYMCMYIQVG